MDSNCPVYCVLTRIQFCRAGCTADTVAGIAIHTLRHAASTCVRTAVAEDACSSRNVRNSTFTIFHQSAEQHEKCCFEQKEKEWEPQFLEVECHRCQAAIGEEAPPAKLVPRTSDGRSGNKPSASLASQTHLASSSPGHSQILSRSCRVVSQARLSRGESLACETSCGEKLHGCEIKSGSGLGPRLRPFPFHSTDRHATPLRDRAIDRKGPACPRTVISNLITRHYGVSFVSKLLF